MSWQAVRVPFCKQVPIFIIEERRIEFCFDEIVQCLLDFTIQPAFELVECVLFALARHFMSRCYACLRGAPAMLCLQTPWVII